PTVAPYPVAPYPVAPYGAAQYPAAQYPAAQYPAGQYPGGAYPARPYSGAAPAGPYQPIPAGYPGHPQPAPPAAYRYPAAPRQPAGVTALAVPVAAEAVPGRGSAVAIVGVSPTASGPAAGSLVTGVGSILVSLVVGCFGAVGAQSGWGPLVAGAFAVLSFFA